MLPTGPRRIRAVRTPGPTMSPDHSAWSASCTRRQAFCWPFRGSRTLGTPVSLREGPGVGALRSFMTEGDSHTRQGALRASACPIRFRTQWIECAEPADSPCKSNRLTFGRRRGCFAGRLIGAWQTMHDPGHADFRVSCAWRTPVQSGGRQNLRSGLHPPVVMCQECVHRNGAPVPTIQLHS